VELNKPEITFPECQECGDALVPTVKIGGLAGWMDICADCLHKALALADIKNERCLVFRDKCEVSVTKYRSQSLGVNASYDKALVQIDCSINDWVRLRDSLVIEEKMIENETEPLAQGKPSAKKQFIDKQQALDMLIEKAGFSERAQTVILRRAKCGVALRDVVRYGRQNFSVTPNCGPVTMKNIEDTLAEYGLELED